MYGEWLTVVRSHMWQRDRHSLCERAICCMPSPLLAGLLACCSVRCGRSDQQYQTDDSPSGHRTFT